MLPQDIPDSQFRDIDDRFVPASAAEKAARPAHETGHGPAAGITHIPFCSRHSPKGILPLLIPACHRLPFSGAAYGTAYYPVPDGLLHGSDPELLHYFPFPYLP